MTDQPQRWDQLGRAISAGIAARGLSVAEAARQVGLSDKHLARIAAGKPGHYRPSTLASASRAAGLDPGAAELILSGDPAQSARDKPPGFREAETLEARVAALEARVEKLEATDPPSNVRRFPARAPAQPIGRAASGAKDRPPKTTGAKKSRPSPPAEQEDY